MGVSLVGVASVMQQQGLPMVLDGFFMEFRCRQMEGLWACLYCVGIGRVCVSHVLSVWVIGVV